MDITSVLLPSKLAGSTCSFVQKTRLVSLTQQFGLVRNSNRKAKTLLTKKDTSYQNLGLVSQRTTPQPAIPPNFGRSVLGCIEADFLRLTARVVRVRTELWHMTGELTLFSLQSTGKVHMRKKPKRSESMTAVTPRVKHEGTLVRIGRFK